MAPALAMQQSSVSFRPAHEATRRAGAGARWTTNRGSDVAHLQRSLQLARAKVLVVRPPLSGLVLVQGEATHTTLLLGTRVKTPATQGATLRSGYMYHTDPPHTLAHWQARHLPTSPSLLPSLGPHLEGGKVSASALPAAAAGREAKRPRAVVDQTSRGWL